MLRIPLPWLLAGWLLAMPGAAAGQQPPVGQQPPTAPPVEPVVPPVEPVIPPVADVARPPFPDWLAELRQEALAKGISEATLDKAFAGLQPVPVVVERDRTQAERLMPLDKYLTRRLDRKTRRTARDMARHHAELLARVSKHYGVPANVIVAVWGLESNFGRFSGVRPTIASLATLAYDNRRASLFREELFDALRILERGDIGVDQMKGSWAGAMGQAQFMPSSYLRYAQDFDEDGRKDIWHSQADVFASIANFLREQGWQPGQPWGRGVRLSSVRSARLGESAPLRTQGCEARRQMTEAMPWSRWKEFGARLDGRQKAPAPATPASLVRAGSRSFLVFDNYGALLQYNCAHAYALSVGLLADSISGKFTTSKTPSKSTTSKTPSQSTKSKHATKSARSKAKKAP